MVHGCAQFLVGRGPRLIVSYSVTRVPSDEMTIGPLFKPRRPSKNLEANISATIVEREFIYPKAKFKCKSTVYSVLYTVMIMMVTATLRSTLYVIILLLYP